MAALTTPLPPPPPPPSAQPTPSADVTEVDPKKLGAIEADGELRDGPQDVEEKLLAAAKRAGKPLTPPDELADIR